MYLHLIVFESSPKESYVVLIPSGILTVIIQKRFYFKYFAENMYFKHNIGNNDYIHIICVSYILLNIGK